MYLGRQLHRRRHQHLVDEFRDDRPDAQILLTKVADPTAFGVAELDEGGPAWSAWRRSRGSRKSDLALVGVYLFTPAVHEAVRAVRPSWRGELEITDAIQWLIDSGATCAPRSSPGTGRTPGTSTTCSRSTGSVLEVVEPVAGTSTRSARSSGASCRGGRRGHAPPHRGARRRRGRHRRLRRLYRPVHLRRRGVPDRGQRDRVLHRAAGLLHRRGARIEASLIGRNVEVTPGHATRPSTVSSSATTARCRSSAHDHPHPRHRRRRLHRLALRAHAASAATRAERRRRHRARQAHLRGQPGQPRPGARPPRLHVRAGRHLRRRTRRRAHGRARPVVHFAAESHVDRSIDGGAEFVRTNVVGTQTLLDAAPAAGVGDVRARLHRRGVRLDRRGLLAGDRPARAQLALLGVQGRPAT